MANCVLLEPFTTKQDWKTKVVNKSKYMLSKQLTIGKQLRAAQIHVTVGTGCTTLKKLIFFRFQMSVVWTVGLLYTTLILCSLTI